MYVLTDILVGVFTYDHKCSCSSVHMHVEARDQEQVPSSITPHVCFETEPLREVGAHLFAGLWAAGTCHPCTPSCGISRAHHQAQVFTLVQRALCQLNHLLAPPSDMLAHFRDGNLAAEPWLTWNSICRPGCPQSQKRSICLSLTSAEIKGEYCH